MTLGSEFHNNPYILSQISKDALTSLGSCQCTGEHGFINLGIHEIMCSNVWVAKLLTEMYREHNL